MPTTPNETSVEQEPAGGLEPTVPSITGLLAFSVGVTVANIYYAQPLLAEMARTFGVTVREIGFVAMLSQIGTATGMFLFVPLGDIRERRWLITMLLFASSFALC